MSQNPKEQSLSDSYCCLIHSLLWPFFTWPQSQKASPTIAKAWRVQGKNLWSCTFFLVAEDWQSQKEGGSRAESTSWSPTWAELHQDDYRLCSLQVPQAKGKGESKSLPPTWEPGGDDTASIILHTLPWSKREIIGRQRKSSGKRQKEQRWRK